MHHLVLIFFFISCEFPTFKCQGISGKLELDSDHKNGFPEKYIKSIKNVENNSDTVTITCTSGGCNSTKSNNVATVETDVVVRVSTKVNLPQNNSNKNDDTPDIPVVVGYKGSRLDETPNEELNRELNEPKSLFTTDFDNIPQSPVSYSSLNNYYDQRGLQTPYDQGNYEPAIVPNPYYTYRSQNVRPLPPISLTQSEISRKFNAENKYQNNRISVPYFNPSYQNHYYSEQQPPYINPGTGYNHNPVAFNVRKSDYKPSIWKGRTIPSVSQNIPYRHYSTGHNCACKENYNSRGIHWHPSTTREHENGDPGSQINDKLAPLN